MTRRRLAVTRCARVACALCFLGAGARASAARAGVAVESPETVHRLWIAASDGAVRHRDLVKPSMDSLIAMGTAAIPALLPYLATEDARERHAITDIFQGIGAAAVPGLVGVLGSGGHYHTLNTLDALGKIGDSSATKAAARFLEDTAYDVRSQAAETIGKTRGAAALPALFGVLHDPVEIVRKSAVVALGRCRDERAIDSVAEVLDDSWFGARCAAADALASLDSAAIVRGRLPRYTGRRLALILEAAADRRLAVSADALFALLNDASVDVSRAAARLIGAAPAGARIARRIGAELQRAQDPLVRYYLRAALARQAP